MTEAEWDGCTDPEKMLEFLQGRASARKLRLFACACCRRIWPWLVKASRDWPDAGPHAVETIERFVDGLAGEEELQAAQEGASWAAEAAARGVEWRAHATMAAAAAAGKTSRWGQALTAPEAAREAAGEAAWVETVQKSVRALAAAPEEAPVPALDWESPRLFQVGVLRDLFGNPFRPPPMIDAGWLSWGDGAVRKLAQTVYEERRFHDLPILADALEEAGCGNADILAHCRTPGEHARGCWLVDLLLARE
jgi:hypothetical protein